MESENSPGRSVLGMANQVLKEDISDDKIRCSMTVQEMQHDSS